MLLEQKIEQIIEPSLEDMNIEVVQINYYGAGKRNVLQILLDRTDDQKISVKDCEKASKTVSALLDVEDVIKSAYNLEVSSAGISRPLNKPAHFKRFIGSPVKVTTTDLINDRRRFSGELMNATDNEIELKTEDQTLSIRYIDIEKAKIDGDKIFEDILKKGAK